MTKSENGHDALPLRTVSRLTGLTADVIRAWERRYGVVAPTRGPRGARLYSAEDVAQLRLLRRAVSSGRAIGDVARLSRVALQDLVGAAEPASRSSATATGASSEILTQAVNALERFDWAALDRCVGDALMALGARAFVEQVAAPLMVDVGERWSDGRLSVADEHLVSGLVQNVLAGVLRTRGRSGQPTVLLATASGERHELGLLMAGLVVAEAGCGLCYLGVDLPAAEVTAAARRSHAAVVGLGVANAESLEASVAEVRRVERDLPATTELWLGGRQAAAAAALLGATRAVVIDRMSVLETETARLRAQRGGA
ncbi:MerR family transcriptional regulator [bacterium]|nr:MerR family transcriptional regulator [bacterium]